jgi:hypothetical protein
MWINPGSFVFGGKIDPLQSEGVVDHRLSVPGDRRI